MHVDHSESLHVELHAGALLPLAALLAVTIGRFGWELGVLCSAMFVLSLLCHESGHLLAARLTGTRVSAVGFCLYGAYNRRHAAKGRAEFWISAAGPAANFAIAALLFGHAGALQWTAEVNLVLGILNLIPLRNSDGQRMLRIIRHRTKPTIYNDAGPATQLAEDTTRPRLAA